jgi:hypothetical protein
VRSPCSRSWMPDGCSSRSRSGSRPRT